LDDGPAPPGGEIGTGSLLESSVPVTAKLSKKFYETFGEDVTNELVNWFNAVDATYRADLRELNETNFQRFDAKLGERLAELDGKWGVRWTELDAKVERRLAELKGELQAQIAQGLGGVETRLVRWLFTFWAPTALAIVGTAIGVVALLLRR
jgi:hypothetical protein